MNFTNTTASLTDTKLHKLYQQLYAQHPAAAPAWQKLLDTLDTYKRNRPAALKNRDRNKTSNWYLSNKITGMSLYVDRFCGTLPALPARLPYLKDLGVNFLHLMPLFQSPEGESDGGYAVSNFREVDLRFGTLADLQAVQEILAAEGMYLMLDMVLNHTSHHHAWALQARTGNKEAQEFYYFFPDRQMPDHLEESLPEVFPEAAPGNFTYVPESDAWVMTVFHQYQWDLNYRNPLLFVEMLANMLFYANLGVDVLRIDAPAFIWKEAGTRSQNLPQVHALLQLFRACVDFAAPGMALLAEAIVAPEAIMQYFGRDEAEARECQIAYNATHMALQWDALATGDTRIMRTAQNLLAQKPLGCTWLNYIRCHDDIGLGYDDWMIAQAGYNPYEHRQFLKDWYTGDYPGSDAAGALFGKNARTGDARISGSLASLCGLEKALAAGDETRINIAVQKIVLMQAHAIFLGGIPMLYYGDEAGYLNDYSYAEDPLRMDDNRWMHRPAMDWEKNALVKTEGTVEFAIYGAIQKAIALRHSLPEISDLKNTTWIGNANPKLAVYIRAGESKQLICLYNFSETETYFEWTPEDAGQRFFDHWRGIYIYTDEPLVFWPHAFYILQPD